MDRLVYDLDGRLETLEKGAIDLQLLELPPGLMANVSNADDVKLSRLNTLREEDKK